MLGSPGHRTSMWHISCRVVFARPLAFGEGRRGAGDVGLVEGNAAGVLHGTQVVFGHVDLVVGTPGEGNAVALVEEVQARACHLEDVLGVEVARERASAGQAQGQLDVPAIGTATAPRGTLDDRPGTPRQPR